MKLGKMKEIMEIFLLLFGLCYFGDMLQITEKTIKNIEKNKNNNIIHTHTLIHTNLTSVTI